MTSYIETLSFVGVCIQSDPACLLLRIQSHLGGFHESMREQANVISLVEMVDER